MQEWNLRDGMCLKDLVCAFSTLSSKVTACFGILDTNESETVGSDDVYSWSDLRLVFCTDL